MFTNILRNIVGVYFIVGIINLSYSPQTWIKDKEFVDKEIVYSSTFFYKSCVYFETAHFVCWQFLCAKDSFSRKTQHSVIMLYFSRCL